MSFLIRNKRNVTTFLIMGILFSMIVSFASQTQSITTNAILDPLPDYPVVGNQEIAYLGEANTDLTGHSISDLGDFNNDGYNDFLIFSKGPSWEGRTHLVFGRSDINLTASYPISSADASFIGSAANQFDTGIPTADLISGIGDVNNDGYDDFAIGSPQNDEVGADAGKLYIVLGGENDWGQDVSVNSVNASVSGEAAGNQLGFWLTGVGDVNNDQFDDFIVTAPAASKIASSNGVVYLILGRQTNQWQLDMSIVDVANASYYGAKNSDILGYPLADVGDVNNDGFDDFLVKSQNNDVGTTSAAHLIFGKTSWTLDQNISLSADASFVPQSILDGEISSMSGIGDINGDNYDDFAIGMYEVGGDQGATYIYLGRSTAQFSKNTVLDNSVITTFHGEGTNQLFGFRVSRGGDFNYDGIDDFLVTSLNYLTLGKGRVYVIFGDTNWTYRNITVDPDMTFTGEVAADYLGADIAGVGDVNGDNKDDLLMSAPRNEEVTTFSGKVYLYMNPFEKPKTVTETDFLTDTTTKTETDFSTDTITTTETSLTISFDTTTFNKEVTDTTTVIQISETTVSDSSQTPIYFIPIVSLLIIIPVIRKTKGYYQFVF